MPQISFIVNGTVIKRAELATSDSALLDAAERAIEGAYAPYSKFNVGAAIRLSNGETVIGSNQENVAYPSGLCAERVALFAASSNHSGQAVEAMAITARTKKNDLKDPLTPCGACRQVILEYQRKQQKPIRLILAGSGEDIWIFEDASVLLPFGFEADYLKRD